MSFRRNDIVSLKLAAFPGGYPFLALLPLSAYESEGYRPADGYPSQHL